MEHQDDRLGFTLQVGEISSVTDLRAQGTTTWTTENQDPGVGGRLSLRCLVVSSFVSASFCLTLQSRALFRSREARWRVCPSPASQSPTTAGSTLSRSASFFCAACNSLFRGCSTSANSSSANLTSASWPKSNWPMSNWPVCFVCSLVCFVSVFVRLLVGAGFCWCGCGFHGVCGFHLLVLVSRVVCLCLLVWLWVFVGVGCCWCRCGFYGGWWFHVWTVPGPLRRTPSLPPQIFVFFFPLSHPFLFSRGGLLVELWSRFKAMALLGSHPSGPHFFWFWAPGPNFSGLGPVRVAWLLLGCYLVVS